MLQLKTEQYGSSGNSHLGEKRMPNAESGST